MNNLKKWPLVLITEILITFVLITFLIVAVENEGFSNLYNPQYFFKVLRGAFANDFFSSDQIYPWYSFLKAFGYTMSLMLISLFFSIGVSIHLSFYLSNIEKKRKSKILTYINGLIHTILDAFLYMASVAPEFWILTLLLVFSVFHKSFLPLTGDEVTTITFNFKFTFLSFFKIIFLYLYYSFAPAAVLSIRFIAIFTTYLRSGIEKTNKSEYIKLSKLRRMANKYIKKELLKGAIIELLSNFTYELPAFITTTAIVEIMYNWPGIGKMYLEYLDNRAILQLYWVSILISFLTITVNFFINIYLVRRNPRIEGDIL